MSEQTGIPPEDTPTPDAPGVSEPETPQIPDGYVPEDRYKEAQAWGTRASQEKAELEQQSRWWQVLATSEDEVARRQAIDALGIEVDDEPEPDTNPMVDPQLAARLEALEQTIQQQSASKQEQEQYASYREQVNPQLEGMNVPAALMDLVADAALQRPPVHTPQGQVADLQGAWQAVEEMVLAAAEMPSLENKLLTKYRESKRAPRISGVGSAGVTALPTDAGHNERVAAMLEQLQADQ